MVNSMTAFAARTGQSGAQSWAWEIRSVNARGLDLRLRLPEGLPGLEEAVRKALAGKVARGNVTLGLRLTRGEGAAGFALDTPALNAALAALKRVEVAALEHNLTLPPPSAAEVLSLKGVVEAGAAPDAEALLPALTADLAPLIDAFLQMRAAEGAALDAVLGDQLARIAELVEAAQVEAEARGPEMAAALKANLARVLDNSDGADPDRVAQELALIAVKSDVREELDRLAAHVEAARALLSDDGPVGRKLDFLMQEFNREANTLCSKAQATALTRIGLDLKTVIDQMREQVQNVE
ncbi:uncharacterized protein Ga0609869_002294 [Rhodovulum iodosum]|uniref:YicC family protein n=1 Tax=Rhodovulum iodosum TaxID=68291 RepID=A0ABV3XUD4_9RHOB|nr:YicC/YloC family endoribonuclease [Rhodovulum robiginosum]RSK34995.1 YicC family protein [Rhodovulum robiginosum]